MAGGIISSNNAKVYPGRVTVFMFLAGIMAASCGLMFGYDIGISGTNLCSQNYMKRALVSH